MEKVLKLALNRYLLVPNFLRLDPRVNAPATTISVGLASLYHHYYVDSHGKFPPDPDPVHFEHVQFLLPTKDFRFQGSGLGIAPAIRRHRSNELGQAFCRWFLHEHFNITYFSHLERILNRQLRRGFNSCRIERDSSGDTPDYFCAESVDRVFLAEAKGRYSAVSFRNKEFDRWRRQFERVVFKDRSGSPRQIKGHIVATRFATEADSASLQSTLYAEDPVSLGDRLIDGDDALELGTALISDHYAGICEKLGQRLLATALESGTAFPDELQVQAVVWEVLIGPLQGRRFVGGYFGPSNLPLSRDTKDGKIVIRPEVLRLDNETGTFFGVEESIFRHVVSLARHPNIFAAQFPRFESLEFFYSGFSVHRDGSALGPVEFFSPTEVVTF